jgi:O-succinylbenzoic acid--CoA ligase
VPVVTTYGMSETCGGCVYDGVPLAGVEVVLDDDGRVSLGGPTVFSGYRLRPDLTADALRDGRLRTADRARWADGADGVRRLKVLGRTDDVVISGGLNVDLAQVERHAAGWPALAADPDRAPAELVVVGVPHPEWGTEVVAVSDRALPVTGLREHLSGTLPGYAAPRRLVVLAGLPRTSSGKIDRQRIRALLSPDPPGEKEGTA